MSVINWVKQAADEIRKRRIFNNEKTNILELDEMCVNLKKIWLWTAVNRETKKLVGFFVGDRSSESFQKLCKNISHIEVKFYATDKFSVYKKFDEDGLQY